MAELDVIPLAELPDGGMRLVPAGGRLTIGVYRCGDDLYAIEDRCTHDDGPLCEGDWDPVGCEVTCPRHGARFDLRTGSALSLPAYLPVATFPVHVRADGMVVVRVDG